MGQRLYQIIIRMVTLLLAVQVAMPQSGYAASANQIVSFNTQSGSQESYSQSDTLIEFTTQSATGQTQNNSAELVIATTDGTIRPEFVSYFAAFVSQNSYPRLLSGQSYEFTVTVRNVGLTAWDHDVVFLGTNRAQDRTPSFIRDDIVGMSPSGWVKHNRIKMKLDQITGKPIGDIDGNGVIDPHESATFVFWMSVPQTMPDAIYREYFNLVAEDIAWFDDMGIYWDVTVDNVPHARWVDQNPYPPTLLAGDSYEFTVRFENTGLIPWKNNGDNPVHLGTDRLQDRVPGFLREGPPGENSGWVGINGNRVKMERDELTGLLIGDTNANDQIDQGEIARFRFWYTIPATMESGTYAEYFRPVMDNRDNGWMEDYGVFWTTVVNHIAPRPVSVTVIPQVNHLAISWSGQPEAKSYKVRYRALGSDVFTMIDFPPSVAYANIDVSGGQSFEAGVASVDDEGVSPFTSTVVYVESPAEVQERVASAVRREEQKRIAEQRRQAEEVEERERPEVIGPPAKEEEGRDWRQFWLTLLIILGAAGLATAGYYGYEWWAESRRSRPARPEPPKRQPPKKEEPPRPTQPTRW